MIHKYLGHLTGQFLISAPQMEDPRFRKTVIYVCGHDKNGAMGLIINRTLPNPSFSELLFQLGIETLPTNPHVKIHFGGPVEGSRGFVLHSPDYMHDATVRITDEVALTATIDIVKAIANGEGPEQSVMALGYTGWSAGQLDSELLSNSWLVAPPQTDLIFDMNHTNKWDRALQSIGIKDTHYLVPEIGRA